MFWTIGSKMPVQANPIVCWKFLQVIHKLMRDGHPNVSAYVHIVVCVYFRREMGMGGRMDANMHSCQCALPLYICMC